MPKIILYIDLSPSRPWLFATIHGNHTLLVKSGLHLGPSNLWSCELIKSNNEYWKCTDENRPIPSGFINRINKLNQFVNSGKDVLLMSYAIYLPSYKLLSNLIRQYIDLCKHEVKFIFVIGRPVCVFEQRWREVINHFTDSIGYAICERMSKISSIINYTCREWGKDNVFLLPNLSDSPIAKPCPELAKNLFNILGCPAPRKVKYLPRHPLFLSSHEARRLSWTLEVRENAWPKLDEMQFMDCLYNLDKDWETAPVSPRKLRQMLIHEGAEDRVALEELLHLPAGSLDCPEWLAIQPETDFCAPLPDHKVRTFASALPSSVRVPLRQRYINDAILLTEDQKALNSALAAVEASNKTVIGEPVPPVDVTVLTMTYNHNAFIAECIESVLAQKTSFPVRHIVLDHHSTDGTADIVASYAAKYPSIQPVLLSQHRLAENAMGLFIRCRTTYAALCDGDDYFTDPLKLQKQIEFLENHPRCTLCFHPVKVIYEDGEYLPDIYPPLSMMPRGVREEYYLSDLFQGNMIQTNSVVYRWRFKDGMPEWFRPGLCPADWYWHLLHAELGKIGFLPEVMSVYRRHKNALYATASISTMEHRRVHGMNELKTYWTVNEHFKNRYFRSLAMLANGVFVNFLEISMNTGDDSLLNQACDAYPLFAQHFLKDLKNVQKERPSFK